MPGLQGFDYQTHDAGTGSHSFTWNLTTPPVTPPTVRLTRRARRIDTTSGTYDLGFRNYDPGLNRFLTRDLFNGALSDMGLAADPFTNKPVRVRCG